MVCVWLLTSEEGQGPWSGKAEAIEPAVLTLPESDNCLLKIFSRDLVACKPCHRGDMSLAKVPAVAPQVSERYEELGDVLPEQKGLSYNQLGIGRLSSWSRLCPRLAG